METNILREVAVWIHHTLLVVGVIATVAFVRVNWFGAEVALETDIVEPLPYFDEKPIKKK